MIRLTRLNHEPFYLNPDMIQEIESTPDTVLMLSSGMRIVVQEAPERVIEQVIDYRRRILSPPAQKRPTAQETDVDTTAESGTGG
jgi:flagellar protein FlbD